MYAGPSSYGANLKRPGERDELLCFLDSDYSDVEFGYKLDTLAGKRFQLTVVVVLDCCFSGGATREAGIRESGVRQRSLPDAPPSPSQGRTSGYDGIDGIDGVDDGDCTSRNVQRSQSWLVRDRHYNVIAACREHETAKEAKDSSGIYHGLLTQCLIEILSSIDRNIFTAHTEFTYSDLEGVLKAKLRARIRECIETGTLPKNCQQHPLFIGKRNKILFDSRKTLEKYQPVSAHVVHVAARSESTMVLTLDKGAAAGINKGDLFSISEPGKTWLRRLTSRDSTDGEIKVTAVQSFSSLATVCVQPGGAARGNTSRRVGQSRIITIGWRATLTKSIRMTEARLEYSQERSLWDRRTINKIKNSWTKEVYNALPVHLSFPTEGPSCSTNSTSVRFHVKLRDQKLIICGPQKRRLTHLPAIDAHQDDPTQKLMYYFRHLGAFFLISELRQDEGRVNVLRGRYRISFKEEYRDNEPSCKITFVNNYDKVLYITVMALTPLYGVQQIFPGRDEGEGDRVRVGATWEENVDFEVPPYLKQRARTTTRSGERHVDVESSYMTDVLKVFIASEPVDFRHYELKDITDAIDANDNYARNPKNTSKPRPEAWCVEEKKIVTRITAD